MGKSLSKWSPRGKLTWGWLVPEDRYAMRESVGMRLLIPVVVGLFLIPIGLCCILCTPAAPVVGFILLAIQALMFSWVVFEPQIRKLNYVYDLGYDSSRAIKWYYSLTPDEKKQLPVGWEDVVRESGEDYISYDKISRYETLSYTVARSMQNAGEEVVSLFRKKNEQPKIPDYRIDTYLQLMSERSQEYSNDLQDRKEVEDKIARMD
jgi:hypothetical protein